MTGISLSIARDRWDEARPGYVMVWDEDGLTALDLPNNEVIKLGVDLAAGMISEEA